MKLALQPCANAISQEHYYETVRNPVPMSTLNIEKLSHLRAASTWGVASDSAARQWGKLSVGDLVLFYGKGGFFSIAKVLHIEDNLRLAQKLWGRDHMDRAWQYMYFVTDPIKIDINIREFNAAHSLYRPRRANCVQSFTVLDQETSDVIINALNLNFIDAIAA